MLTTDMAEFGLELLKQAKLYPFRHELDLWLHWEDSSCLLRAMSDLNKSGCSAWTAEIVCCFSELHSRTIVSCLVAM